MTTEPTIQAQHRALPRYPIYVISKGRWGVHGLTARFLLKDQVPFHLVIEPQEEPQYREAFPTASILILPFSNLGLGGIPARNWVWDHAQAAGVERYWILDDNIRSMQRWYGGKRINVRSGPVFALTEDFVERYENVPLAGYNYAMFGHQNGKISVPPFFTNVHVYSCFLLDTALPYRWRGRYNEDTDLCLQVLANGLCTISLNAFMIQKMPSMTMKGGNSTELYKGDGRLKMARSLERLWPGVVTTDRRWHRPQHVVADNWKRFDTPLKLRQGVDLSALPKVDEHGLYLTAVKTPKSARLRGLLESETQKRLAQQMAGGVGPQ